VPPAGPSGGLQALSNSSSLLALDLPDTTTLPESPHPAPCHPLQH
jgi:hypothetical protein